MKFFKIILAATFCILIGSCTKILDKKNLSAVNEQDVWNDMALATAYVDMLHAQNLPSWSTEFADYSEESDGGGSYMYGQLTENSVNYWPYDDIRDINILLSNIDNGSLSTANKRWLKGQAYFFRAWRYFEMVTRYGGVPLILEPQELTDDLFVSRASTSATVQQIIKDLDSAITMLPAVMASGGENKGRIHRGTAHAIKGRVLLTYASEQFDPSQAGAGRWQAAYDANKVAKDFLTAQGFGLHPSFAGLWFNEMNKEVIFVKRYAFTPNIASTFHNWSASTRPLEVSQGATGGNRPTLEIVNAFPMKDGRPITDATSAYDYDPEYFWKNRDPRFKETIVYNGAIWGLGLNGPQTGRIQWNFVGAEPNSPTLTGFYMRKAVDTTQSAIQAFNSGTDWIELRYAEVLLNLAEAANEIGKTSEAYTELKAIRARAGIDPGTNNLYGLEPNMTKDQMRNAIMDERQIEFAFEAKRYWDLRRRRMFASELNGKKRNGLTIQLKIPRAQFDSIRNSMTPNQFIEHLNQNYTNYFTHTVRVLDTQFPINWKPEYYFFAIPSQHLQLNSNLKQTNGWAGGSFDPLL